MTYIPGNSSRKNLTKSKRLDFVIRKGDTFFHTEPIYDVDANGEQIDFDFTDTILKSQVRKIGNKSKVYLEFLLSTSDNNLSFFADTEDMRTIEEGLYEYDVEVYDDYDGIARHRTILHGSVRITSEVTKFEKVNIANVDILFNNELTYLNGITEKIETIFSNQLYMEILTYLQENSQIELTNESIVEIFNLLFERDEKKGFQISLGNEVNFSETLWNKEVYGVTFNNEIYFVGILVNDTIMGFSNTLSFKGDAPDLDVPIVL